MTWGQLKATLEANGVKDSTIIGWIDIDPGLADEVDLKVVFEDYPTGTEVTVDMAN